MVMVAIFVMWPGPFEQTLVPIHIKFEFNLPSEKMFENVDG